MRGDCSALDSETLSDFLALASFSTFFASASTFFASAFAAVSTFLASAFTSLATSFSTVLVLFSTFSASCFASSLIAVALLVVGAVSPFKMRFKIVAACARVTGCVGLKSVVAPDATTHVVPCIRYPLHMLWKC